MNPPGMHVNCESWGEEGFTIDILRVHANAPRMCMNCES